MIDKKTRMMDAGMRLFETEKPFGTVLGGIKTEMAGHGKILRTNEIVESELPEASIGCDLFLDRSTRYKTKYITCKLEEAGMVGTTPDGEGIHRYAVSLKLCFEKPGVLTDAEKRSGTALIDFGAGTTTISVLKNNIVRQIITLPMGISNITQDLCDLQIEPSEAEQLMLTYADATADITADEENEQLKTYTTSDGRQIEVREIHRIIGARLHEILLNVENQLHNSDYADKLLGGIVITGGGANIPNIEKACTSTLKVDKVRVARKLIPPIIKNSDITTLSLESTTSCTIVSLLLSGSENCVGEEYKGPDMFRENEKVQEIEAHKEATARLQQEEDRALEYIEQTKTQLRETILKLQQTSEAITNDESNKKLHKAAEAFIEEAHGIITDDFKQNKDLLVGKDKYKQSLREADILITKCDEEAEGLKNLLKELTKKNSFLGKVNRWIDDILKE